MEKFNGTLVLFRKTKLDGDNKPYEIVYARLGHGFFNLKATTEADTSTLLSLAERDEKGALLWKETKNSQIKSLNLGIVEADLEQTDFQDVTYPDGTVGVEPAFAIRNPRRGIDKFSKAFLG